MQELLQIFDQYMTTRGSTRAWEKYLPMHQNTNIKTHKPLLQRNPLLQERLRSRRRSLKVEREPSVRSLPAAHLLRPSGRSAGTDTEMDRLGI